SPVCGSPRICSPRGLWGGDWLMNPMLLIIVFVAVSGMVGAIAFALRDFGNTRAEDRLQVMAGLKTPALESRGMLKEEVLKEGVTGLSGSLQRLTSRLLNLKNLFVQADSPISVNAFFGLTLGLALLGAAAGVVARTPTPLIPVIALLFGSMPL